MNSTLGSVVPLAMFIYKNKYRVRHCQMCGCLAAVVTLMWWFTVGWYHDTVMNTLYTEMYYLKYHHVKYRHNHHNCHQLLLRLILRRCRLISQSKP